MTALAHNPIPDALWSLGCLFVLKGRSEELEVIDAIVPPATPHSFETLGDTPSRMLDIVTPAGLWDFFAECGQPAQALLLPDQIHIPPDLPQIVSRYAGQVVGPPLNRPGLRLEK